MNKLKYIILVLFLLVGCSNNKVITNLDYLNKLSNELNIKDYTNTSPYFSDINETNDSFINIQSLVEWNVLNIEDNIEFNKELEYNFIHYTYNNLFDYISYDNFIKDLNDHNIINKLYKDNDIVNNTDLNNIINYIKLKINNPKVETKHDIDLKEDIIYIDNIDDINLYDYNNNQLISYKDNYQNTIKRIKYKNNNISLEDVLLEDIINNIDIENNMQIDFSKATIIDNDNNVIEPKEFEQTSILSKSFEFNGYYVSYKFNNGTFNVYVSNKSKNNLNYYGELDLYSIDVKYKYKSSTKGIDEAFFKINYDTNLKSGISIGKYYDRYSNLEFNDGDNILEKIKNSFKEKKELETIKIPIATIKVPIPGTYVCDIVMKLQLHIYASGKAEFSLVSDAETGFEIKNNKFRFINNINNDLDFNLRASANATVNLLVGLQLLSQDLLDAGIKVGIKGEVQPTLHIYDNDNISSTKVDIPIDLLEEKIDDHNVSFCTDLSLYYVTQLEFNSASTLANTLNFNKVINILDKDNQVLKNEFTHIENNQFVEKCTKLNKLGSKPLPELDSNKIVLDKYQHIIKKDTNKEFTIVSLPNGYTNKDIIYESLDNDISIIKDNKIYGINKGNTIINIKTKDNKYKIQIHILVN